MIDQVMDILKEMKPKTFLIISAIYLALVGLGYFFVPDIMLFGELG